MQRRFLSVAELAQACSPTDIDGDLDRDRLQTWIRRLRHWSTIGVFPAEAIRHAKAGRHRLYSADLVYLTAVLLWLSSCGISSEVIKSISKEIQAEIPHRSFAEFWERAKQPNQTENKYYLLIWDLNEGAEIYLERAIATPNLIQLQEEFDPSKEPTLLVSLSDVFAGIALSGS